MAADDIPWRPYSSEDFADGQHRYDVILDVGGNPFPFVGPKLGTFVASENAEDLMPLRELIDSGQLASTVDRSFPLSAVAAAIRYMLERHARGKVVVTV